MHVAKDAMDDVLGCRIVRQRCKSIWCPRCGPLEGWRLRGRLAERYEVREVKTVGFATLTCSPAVLGDDPRAQYEAVKDGRLVARFVRLFRSVVGRKVAYLSVMEFQHRSGQVHFHVVLDGCGRLGRESLGRLQAWCQQQMGTFDYKYMSSERAIRYCLKYLTKGAYESLPEWCLDYDGRLRPYTASRGFWHDGKLREAKEATGERRVQRTLRVRIERCDEGGVVGLREWMKDDGELSYVYSFSWSVAFETVRQVACAVVADDAERVEIAQAQWGFWLSVRDLREVVRRVFDERGAARRGAADGPPLRLVQPGCSVTIQGDPGVIGFAGREIRLRSSV